MERDPVQERAQASPARRHEAIGSQHHVQSPSHVARQVEARVDVTGRHHTDDHAVHDHGYRRLLAVQSDFETARARRNVAEPEHRLGSHPTLGPLPRHQLAGLEAAGEGFLAAASHVGAGRRARTIQHRRGDDGEARRQDQRPLPGQHERPQSTLTSGSMAQDDAQKVLVTNRKAFFNYEILERHEAGLSLRGTEVKSIREGGLNFRDAYVEFRAGELFLVGALIGPYSHGNILNHAGERDRKLLLHKREILKLGGKVTGKGFTIVPLKAYLKNGLVKLEIGLARGKKSHDKREAIKRKDIERETRQAMRRS
jgi:SsrA-binding protein